MLVLIRIKYEKHVVIKSDGKECVNRSHCLIINLAQKGVCLKNRNLAQIKMVPAGHGGTNEVRYENEKESLRANF